MAEWKALEAPLLRYQVQVTSREMFVKAGEAYFSPDSSWIIFQAVPVPEGGKEPEPFYSMYVAKVIRNEGGRVTGIERPIRVSNAGSANTCGWFHPTEPWRIMFGSTMTEPKNQEKSGFSVRDRKYVWMFPSEMDVVTVEVAEIAKAMGRADQVVPGPAVPRPLIAKPNYDAECSWSKDGRYVLYAHVRDEQTRGRPDADIFIRDTKTGKDIPLVTADGYDGGPFFSPDETMICYRSDRKGDDLLQLYVAGLKRDSEGVPTGITREQALTDNSDVNWCPYFHPSGRFVVYATSSVSHGNYEVFACEVPDIGGDTPRQPETIGRRRVTFGEGADVLPAFSPDSRLMMWTAQRGPMVAGEQKPSSQLWIAECTPGGFDTPEAMFLGVDVKGLNSQLAESIARAELAKREKWTDVEGGITFQMQVKGDLWVFRAWHPSRKPGEGRVIAINRAGEMVSYTPD